MHHPAVPHGRQPCHGPASLQESRIRPEPVAAATRRQDLLGSRLGESHLGNHSNGPGDQVNNRRRRARNADGEYGYQNRRCTHRTYDPNKGTVGGDSRLEIDTRRARACGALLSSSQVQNQNSAVSTLDGHKAHPRRNATPTRPRLANDHNCPVAPGLDRHPLSLLSSPDATRTLPKNRSKLKHDTSSRVSPLTTRISAREREHRRVQHWRKLYTVQSSRYPTAGSRTARYSPGWDWSWDLGGVE
ncbi:hypothetical protein BRADI_5g09323v3 [Brachypodium distachyon]|uniref:Uncharacterized protein n=1 Tax=Brachypodium distachyon TaxID=15368 RepID=A0A2K2CG70_BRADI|nr:hypothetical protein BRADI_5g09323v3 [Brachypodium distachyon]